MGGRRRGGGGGVKDPGNRDCYTDYYIRRCTYPKYTYTHPYVAEVYIYMYGHMYGQDAAPLVTLA